MADLGDLYKKLYAKYIASGNRAHVPVDAPVGFTRFDRIPIYQHPFIDPLGQYEYRSQGEGRAKSGDQITINSTIPQSIRVNPSIEPGQEMIPNFSRRKFSGHEVLINEDPIEYMKRTPDNINAVINHEQLHSLFERYPDQITQPSIGPFGPFPGKNIGDIVLSNKNFYTEGPGLKGLAKRPGEEDATRIITNTEINKRWDPLSPEALTVQKTLYDSLPPFMQKLVNFRQLWK